MSDIEDAGMWAMAFGAKADILVTDNMKDLAARDAIVAPTWWAELPQGEGHAFLCVPGQSVLSGW